MKAFTLLARAFTLIELLIVVAIIAILAAIAVPNLLEAQTRSKVSRTKADLRTIATALESYAVDNNRYPAYVNPLDHLNYIFPDLQNPVGLVTFVATSLTTPIGYLTSLPSEVFIGDQVEPKFRSRPVYYLHVYPEERLGFPNEVGQVSLMVMRSMGESRPGYQWVIWSQGPDRDDDSGFAAYDPTNGTVSGGDIGRFGP